MKIMKRMTFLILISLAVFILIPVISRALTDQEIMRATHIVSLEAQPVWFSQVSPSISS